MSASPRPQPSSPAFKREGYSDVVEEIKPLIEEHWAEIALYKEFVPLDVNYAIYEALQKAGILRIYTVRNDGFLIGYAIYFVQPHPHYQTTKIATADIYWLHPSHRNAGTGIGLFSFAESQLMAEISPGQVMVMHTGSKVQHPQAHRVLEFLGHEVVEVHHSKILIGKQ